MAKKAPVKKSKRRLKRSIRRSLAAVLMVTSIAVAAIPVPENAAAPGDDPVTADAYEEQVKLSDPIAYDTIGSDSKTIYSLVVYEGGLYWQYRIDSKKTKVVQYNAKFPSISLSVSQSVPTNYDYVLKSEFDTFCATKYVLNETNYYDSASQAAKRFFEQYFKTDTEYVEFKKKIENGENASIERGVANLSDLDRRTYYCNINSMPDYVLEPVKVEINSDGDDINVITQIKETGKEINPGDDIYIPKYAGTNKAPENEVDGQGYRLFSGTTSHSNTQRITQIGNYAFAGSGILKTIDLPDWLQNIGEGAFMGCSYLEAVNIPFLTNVPDGAFKNCTSLRTVNWWSEGNTSGLEIVGKEAFYGTGVQENASGQGVLKFPIGIRQIDDAAFYGCGALKQIDFDSGGAGSTTSNQVSIGKYAFYNDSALSSVSFQGKAVSELGDYCFAIGVNSNVLNTFTFPNSSFKTGKKILGKRTALREIVVPENVGNLSGDILEGCTGLKSATFAGVDTTYAPELFTSVTQEDFYVTGPATMDPNAIKDDVKNASNPRKSTWDAHKTALNQYVPYLYKIGGREFYEICSGDGFLESIDKATGTLTSCDVRDKVIPAGSELVIPDQVGNTPVVKIDSNCFTGKTQITSKVGKLTIGNNVTEIGDSVFQSWPVLNEVNIGSAIQKIGKKAFADCKELTDVTFETPGNYETLTIDEGAFDTNSGKLILHGDLVDGYAPFEYAVNPAHYVTKSGPTGKVDKYRILYQSRWDSPSSKHMSVIYGEQNDGKGYVTLVDYPLYQDFFSVDADGNVSPDLSADLQAHNQNMERDYYAFYGGSYTEPSEEDPALERKVRFAKDYDDNGDAAYDGEYYGPWINPSFCDNYTRWLEQEWQDKFASAENTTWDWLLKPMTVKAAGGNPNPYFKKHPYNFVENYLEKNGDRSLITFDYLDGWTTDEEKMIEAVNKITIPKGIESIDLTGYYWADVPDDSAHQNVVSNSSNYIAYFGNSSSSNRKGIFVYDVPKDEAGLFRSTGIDDHYNGNNIDYGEHKKGNDRIKEVDMSQSNIVSIPDYAFEDCELLEKVTIPATCQSVGALPFKDCTRLNVLYSDSEYVPAKNGIIYQKKPDNSYELVECILTRGEGGENTYVDSATDGPYLDQVSSIGESAFQNCNGISVVDLSGIDNGAASEKLKTIPDHCFENCNKLMKVYLPLATNDIGQRAFADIRKDAGEAAAENARLEVTIKGTEVNISETAFDPKAKTGESTINMVTIWTYENSAAERYVLEQQKLGYDIRLGNQPKDHSNPQYLGKSIRVNFWDWNADPLCDTIYLSDVNKNWIREEDIPAEVIEKVTAEGHRPGYKFKDWLASGGQKIGEPITTDEITYVAQYSDDGTMVDGKYAVEFYDSFDWSSMICMGATNVNGTYVCYVTPNKSFNDMASESPAVLMSAPAPNPHHDGYEFIEWKDTNGNTYNDAAAFNETKITGNMKVVALYKSNGTTSGGSTTTSSGTTSNNGVTNTSGNTTNNNNNNNSNNNTSSKKSSSTSSTSSSTSSSSTSTSSTTSDGQSVTMYTVLVQNGSGSGSYVQGTTVIVSAYPPAEGMVFSNWTTESNGVTLASTSTPVTAFVMPGNNVTITANYVPGTAGTSAPVNTAGGTTTTVPDGNTTVDITKPGISNKDLATANVNGSTDNFIIKISETDAATQAVAAALTNKYGSLENLLYYAMDITLWDATGTYQLTGDQVAGLSVDITIPIPDSLVAYGGNNMAGAVVNGDQLENLNENFTTINGVPCIRFQATHFSPYTIYVDTGNLTEGMLDVTPKTGDPIHPKWFLSIGLACLSIALFMKKDKKAKVKTA